MAWSVRGRNRAQRLAEADDLGARLDKLQDAANTASSHARNVYVTFLLFGLYLAIIFGATTHEQLLRESPVTLPLLNVGLPLFGFYSIAPALFVLLHLNLLLQFYLLSGKLHRFDRTLRKAIARGVIDRERANDRRAQLYPFPFSQMLVGRQHGRLMRFLLWLMVWITVLVLPVVLLLMCQVRFLPYHDAWTTMWQRFMVLVDVLLILIFWRAIRYPGDRLLWHPGRWLWHQAKVLSLGLVALALSFFVLTFPAGDGDGEFGDPMADLLAGGWLRQPSQVAFETFPLLQRNLVVTEANLVASWPTQSQIDQFGEDLGWQNFGAPPDLRGRDLRYADFSRSIFVRGDFRQANLKDVSLNSANLQDALLSDTNLQGANFDDTNLDGANLVAARLQGASLSGANLQGANLAHSNLQGATLHGADLQGADLAESNLQGASAGTSDSGKVNLQGADLTGARLEGAFLWGANLQGASLSDANLQGANLGAANLQGADLRSAHFWRTHLGSNHWALANLTGADADPISDLDTWIKRETAEIADVATRDRVRDRLLSVLNDDRSGVPAFPEAWRSAPGIMFKADDPLAEALGWGAIGWETADDYERARARFLGNLACGEGTSVHVARRLASGILGIGYWTAVPLHSTLFASRLIGDDCPPAAELSDDMRRELKELVERFSGEDEDAPH